MIRRYSDHAANERTFLAWVRTGLAVLAFGFVIEKFNLFIVTMATASSLDAGRLLELERATKFCFSPARSAPPPTARSGTNMNEKKVPQLFVSTGATKWDDPKGHPWTMGFFVSSKAEGCSYADYILKNKPDGKKKPNVQGWPF